LNLATAKWKLVLTGIGVVAASVIMSMAATHASFMLSEEVTYQASMLTALIIPLLVAPPAYAYVARLTWQLKRANEQLDILAHKDPLTGLANRRAFVEAANARIAAGQPHLLAMIDIDHFKRINDRLGHAGGDSALRHAADTLRGAAPPGSLLARLGGEEFGLLLTMPCDDGEAARLAAEAHVEAMRLQLASLPLITPNGRVHVTASFGLATTRPGEPLDALLNRADHALYAAKEAGRNCLRAVG
jgi:diguanylate cyclase (GGDEF)-like protein